MRIGMVVGLLFLVLGYTQQGLADEAFAQRPDVQQFIQTMVTKYHFDKDKLTELFASIELRPEVIETLKKPYEAQPWYIYNKHFLDDKRVSDGVAFWQLHQAVLAKTEKEFGVPASIIVAIIGVESSYGAIRGKYPVLNTLATIGFDYPKRGPYFQSELQQFLLLSREQNWDPATILGSYAGAVGQPQFMPSSYRRFGIDYSRKQGHVDLFDNVDDIIGSTGNYLRSHGWEPGAAIATQATVTGVAFKNIPQDTKKPSMTLADLAKLGVTPQGRYHRWDKAIFFSVDADAMTQQYWLGFNNFYVITRYNTSKLYALAVTQLAEKITAARAAAQASPTKAPATKAPSTQAAGKAA